MERPAVRPILVLGIARVRVRRFGAAGAGAPAAVAAVEGAAGAADWLPARPGIAARLGGDADPPDCGRPGAAGVRVGCVAALLGHADRVLLARPDARVLSRG